MKWFQKRRTRKIADRGGKHGYHSRAEPGAQRHGHQPAHLNRLRAHGERQRSPALHDGKLVRVQLGGCGRELDVRQPLHALPGERWRFLLRPGRLVQRASPYLDLAVAVLIDSQRRQYFPGCGLPRSAVRQLVLLGLRSDEISTPPGTGSGSTIRTWRSPTRTCS